MLLDGSTIGQHAGFLLASNLFRHHLLRDEQDMATLGPGFERIALTQVDSVAN